MTSLCPCCQGELRICADNGIVTGVCYNCSQDYILSVPEAYREERCESIESDEPDRGIIYRNGGGVKLRLDAAERIIANAIGMGLKVSERPRYMEHGILTRSWNVDADDRQWMAMMGVSA